MTNVAADHPDFLIDLGDTFAMDNVNSVSGAENAYLYQRSTSIWWAIPPVFLAAGTTRAGGLAPGRHGQSGHQPAGHGHQRPEEVLPEPCSERLLFRQHRHPPYL